jgi:Dullard-like phosphatase family protein
MRLEIWVWTILISCTWHICIDASEKSDKKKLAATGSGDKIQIKGKRNVLQVPDLGDIGDELTDSQDVNDDQLTERRDLPAYGMVGSMLHDKNLDAQSGSVNRAEGSHKPLSLPTVLQDPRTYELSGNAPTERRNSASISLSCDPCGLIKRVQKHLLLRKLKKEEGERRERERLNAIAQLRMDLLAQSLAKKQEKPSNPKDIELEVVRESQKPSSVPLLDAKKEEVDISDPLLHTSKQKAVKSLLPPSDGKKPCLVLDLDETLVHSELNYGIMRSQGNFDIAFFIESPDKQYKRLVTCSVRPGAREFLAAMAKVYEVVIFTAGDRAYASTIIDFLDPNHQYVSYRLYRESCTHEGGVLYIKHLSLLGRPLEKVIIIDNTPHCFKYHKENGLLIPTWTGESSDRVLEAITPFLIEIAIHPELRLHLDPIREIMNQFSSLAFEYEVDNSDEDQQKTSGTALDVTHKPVNQKDSEDLASTKLPAIPKDQRLTSFSTGSDLESSHTASEDDQGEDAAERERKLKDIRNKLQLAGFGKRNLFQK